MIGLFDSGFGGLTILRALETRLPDLDYLYLGDNARAPYGSRSSEEIYTFTKQGVAWLFEQGCPLVILACNTASANALRRLQQEWLPTVFPDRRVLGILVPTVEQVSRSDRNSVLVLATEATVRSEAYTNEVAKLNPRVRVIERACPRVVPLVESGAPDAELLEAIRACTSDIPSDVTTALLGCTHYPLVRHLFRDVIPERIVLLDQAEIVAEQTAAYLTRHPEIESKLMRNAARRYATTGEPESVSTLAERFYGRRINFERAVLAT